MPGKAAGNLALGPERLGWQARVQVMRIGALDQDIEELADLQTRVRRHIYNAIDFRCIRRRAPDRTLLRTLVNQHTLYAAQLALQAPAGWDPALSTRR